MPSSLPPPAASRSWSPLTPASRTGGRATTVLSPSRAFPPLSWPGSGIDVHIDAGDITVAIPTESNRLPLFSGLSNFTPSLLTFIRWCLCLVSLNKS
ncbi:unnamed protein product [Somion occarium]|uniref:Uncharacterized protein n=1 Tax=Somion occarium TaxID=3059160 RepID=A0ABP1CSW6_9APHY